MPKATGCRGQTRGALEPEAEEHNQIAPTVMSGEPFIEWCPVVVDAPTVGLEWLRDDEHGLSIRIPAGGQLVEISFEIVVAYRSTLEEASADFWPRFHTTKPSEGPFWVVEDSDWLATFSSADLCLYPEARHYLIITHDERIDVIATRTPVARTVESM